MTSLAWFLPALCLIPRAAFGQDAPAAQVIAAPAEAEYNLGLPLTFVDAAAEGELVVRLDEQENGDRLELRVTRAEAVLSRVTGEATTPLGEPAAIGVAEDGAVAITLRRRVDRVSVLVGPRCVLTAWEDAAPGKLSLTAAEALLKPDDIFYQPYAPPEFTDDFMRAASDPTGEWQVAAGTWDNTALIDSVDFAPRAANSFAFAAHAQPTAMATTGPAFWDDLRCSVAVRLPESGRAGLGFRVQDAANYYSLTLQFGAPEAFGRALLKLSKVANGVEQVLASATRNLPIGQWYNLSAAVSEDRVEASVDGVPVLAARDGAFGEGSVALVAADCETAYFDDAKVEEYRGFFDDFEANGHARWRTIAGEWKTESAKEGKHIAAVSREAAVTIAGRDDWTDYEYRADVLAGKGAAGLCFYWKGPTDHFLWRAARGKQELVRVTEAGEQVLDEAPLEGASRGWLKVLVRAGRDYVFASVNGGPRVEAIVPAGQSGRIGLWADRGSRAAFDNIQVRFPPGYVPAVLPETMVTDVEMKEQFANPAEGWFSITDEAHQPQAVGMNWNKGEYFDPVDVTFPLSIASAAAGKVTVRMEADQTGGEGDYELTLAKPESSRKLAVDLSRSGEALEQGEYDVGESGSCQVRFGKRGTFIVVYLDDGLVLSYRDRPEPVPPPPDAGEPAGVDTAS
jgi:hypothetical protein